MEKLRLALESYRKDERFTNFTIECEESGKEFKVYSCYVAAQSGFFESVFEKDFLEKEKQKIVLKENLPEAVECMMEYFYKLDYDLPSQKTDAQVQEQKGNEATATLDNAVKCRYPIQMHAWCTPQQRSTLCPASRSSPSRKFKKAGISAINSKAELIAAVDTIYNHIDLPDNDDAVVDILLDVWVLATGHLYNNMEGAPDMVSLYKLSPGFAADYTMRLMAGFKDSKMCIHCPQCDNWRDEECTTNGVPPSDMPWHNVQVSNNGFGSGGFRSQNRSSATRYAGQKIKDEVEVLGAVNLTKFW